MTMSHLILRVSCAQKGRNHLLAIECKKLAQKENKKCREIAWDSAKRSLESFPDVQKLKTIPLTHEI